jgi:hypothetical protein
MLLKNENGDPNALGMFSKAGKFTSQKYSVFQKKDEILQDKPKYLRVSHFPQFEMNFHEDDEKGDDDTKFQVSKKYDDSDLNDGRPPKPHMEWKKMTSRAEHFMEKTRMKRTTGGPRVGLYHPKKVEAHKKNLPDYTTELKLRPVLSRFEWVDHRHMAEMKDIDIEISEGKPRQRLTNTPYIDRVESRHDIRDINGTRFKNRFQYRPHSTGEYAEVQYHKDQLENYDPNGTEYLDSQTNFEMTQDNWKKTPKILEATIEEGAQEVHWPVSEENTDRGMTKSHMTKSHKCFAKTGTTFSRTAGSFRSSAFSSSKDLRGIPFEKYRERDTTIWLYKKTNGNLFTLKQLVKVDPSYDPKFGQVKPRIDSLCIRFDKGSGRSYDPM